MKRLLTKSTAKQLIQRETGISHLNLEAPPSMNHDTKFPYFETTTGNLRISLYFSAGDPDRELIIMDMEHLNSMLTVREYFYSDTLEYAEQNTQYHYWESLGEIVSDTDPFVAESRLLKEAQTAIREHRLGKK